MINDHLSALFIERMPNYPKPKRCTMCNFGCYNENHKRDCFPKGLTMQNRSIV